MHLMITARCRCLKCVKGNSDSAGWVDQPLINRSPLSPPAHSNLPPPSSSVCLTTTTPLTRAAVHRHCSGYVCICPSSDRRARHRRERFSLRPRKGRGRLVESQEEG